jgi:hypothetical protein
MCVVILVTAEVRQAKSAHGSLRKTKWYRLLAFLIVGGFSDFPELPMQISYT